LIKAREKAGLTQLEVATQLNKPQSYISKIELGERKIDFVELEDLCSVYNLPITSFITMGRKEENKS
jgi:transcriptional regulator with XRE-family HTH domain